MDIGAFFNVTLVQPLTNILIICYHAVSFFGIPYAFGFAIILLTIIIRIILYPLTHSQLKATKKMQAVAPHISHVRNKHKGDMRKIQEETMRIYREHGVNPAAGCLPLLVQMPLLFALYPTLAHLVNTAPAKIVAEVNKQVYFDFLQLAKPWDTHFFGFPLGQNPSQLLSVVPLILLVPVVTGVLQFIQSKMMSPSSEGQKAVVPHGSKENKQDDFQKAFQTQTTYVFPIMIAFLSYTFPIGLSLYWNTFTLFGILQQYKVSGLGGLTDIKNKLWKNK